MGIIITDWRVQYSIITVLVIIILVIIFVPIIPIWKVYDGNNPLCWVDGCGGPLPDYRDTINISLADYLTTDFGPMRQGMLSHMGGK